LEQEAAVLARLGVTWYDDKGKPQSKSMGPYLPRPNFVHYNLNTEGVPPGSLVCSVHRYQLKLSLSFFFGSAFVQVKFYLDVSVTAGAFQENIGDVPVKLTVCL
jgi:hypothetical protein